jgi:hypothetical protein
MRAELFAKANQILREVLFPNARRRRRACVNGANTGIGVRLEGGLRVRPRPGVMRAVIDACDASVQKRQHGEKVADVDVVRPILEREIPMQRVDLLGQIDVRNRAAKLVLPAMAMTVDDS